MNAIIFGSGSVAEKHIKNCLELNIKVFILSKATKQKKRLVKKFKNIKFIDELKNIKSDFFSFGIIANKTSEHFKYIKFLSQKNINIYCEKPIVYGNKKLNFLSKKIKKNKLIFLSGYQLLEDPIIQKIKEKISNQLVNSFNFRVGNNYRYWRNQESHKDSYYLNNKKGGGVINELIHEVNLIHFFFGDIKKIKTFYKTDKKNMYDHTAVSIIKKKKKIIGTLYQDMFSENYFRNFQIITKKFTIEYDFGNKFFELKNNKNSTKKIFIKEPLKNNLLKIRLLKFIELVKSKKNDIDDFNRCIKDLKIIKKMYGKK